LDCQGEEIYGLVQYLIYNSKIVQVCPCLASDMREN
jgi:hypothetical protein